MRPQIRQIRFEIAKSAPAGSPAQTKRQYGHYNVTMKRARYTIPAGKFKAKCLGLLDQVANSGEILVITKRGKPVARLVPIERALPKSLRGSVRVHGDVVGPTGERWDAER
jgi:prevent-host-death family protein